MSSHVMIQIEQPFSANIDLRTGKAGGVEKSGKRHTLKDREIVKVQIPLDGDMGGALLPAMVYNKNRKFQTYIEDSVGLRAEIGAENIKGYFVAKVDGNRLELIVKVAPKSW